MHLEVKTTGDPFIIIYVVIVEVEIEYHSLPHILPVQPPSAFGRRN